MKHHIFRLLVLLTVPFHFSVYAQESTHNNLPEGAIARLGKGGINNLQFSTDGNRLIVGTNIGLWLYDVKTGDETGLLTNPPGQVKSLAFSSDGNTLAIGGYSNKVIQFWDLKTKNKIKTLSLENIYKPLQGLFLDGTTLLSLNDQPTLTYWNVETGKKLREYELVGYTNVFAFSPDGNELALLDEDHNILLWNTSTGKRKTTLTVLTEDLQDNESGRILALAYSIDGKFLACGIEDTTVRIWDTEKQVESAILKAHDGWVTSVAFSHDGSKLVSGGTDNQIILWDLNLNHQLDTFLGHTNSISVLAFSPDNKTVASASIDGTLHLWNIDTGSEITTLATDHVEWVKGVAFDRLGTTLTSVAFNGIVDIWNVKTKSHQDTIRVGHCDMVSSVTLSQDGELMILNTGEGRVTFNRNTNGYHAFLTGANVLQLWNITTGEEIQGPWQNRSGIGAISPHNDFLVILDWQDIYAWHIKTGVELLNSTYSKFPRPSALRNSKITVSPDGAMIASIIKKMPIYGILHLWNIKNNEKVHIPSYEKVLTVAFSPKKPLLAIATLNGTKLVNLDKNGEFNDISLDNLKVRGKTLTFSPNGNFLLGGDRNSGIVLWDINSGDRVLTLNGHTNDIETLVFSDDGKMLASGSRDGTILLWDWEKISSQLNQ